MSGVHYAKSFYDLMQNAEFKKAVVEEDKKKMEELLFSIGFDITQGYDLVSVLHRPETTKEPWLGIRVEGFERTDSHAQIEVQEVAKQVGALVKEIFPVSWSALVGE